jgi:hypothetical protein
LCIHIKERSKFILSKTRTFFSPQRIIPQQGNFKRGMKRGQTHAKRRVEELQRISQEDAFLLKHWLIAEFFFLTSK